MSTRSSATLAIGFEERRLPYLYSGPLDEACRSIAKERFDAVELLVPSPELLSQSELAGCLTKYGLELSAMGTGGAYLTGKWHLCSPNPSVRKAAAEFIRGIIDLAAPHKASVILGLVTGFLEPSVTRDVAFGWLVPALNELEAYARPRAVNIVIEPLNRYESNFINRLQDGLELISRLESGGIKLLADLFHMNMEEASIERAIRQAGSAIGHVHFSDSNRWAPGMGHTDFAPIVDALSAIRYSGYMSVEAFPDPDSNTAASNAVNAYRQWFAE